MTDFPSIESIDRGLKDDVWQVFHSEQKPFRSARKLYVERRTLWIKEMLPSNSLRITVKGPNGTLASITLDQHDVVSAFAAAISVDEDLIRIVKSDGLEKEFGFDNRTLARIFVIHILAGEPYLYNTQ